MIPDIQDDATGEGREAEAGAATRPENNSIRRNSDIRQSSELWWVQLRWNCQ